MLCKAWGFSISFLLYSEASKVKYDLEDRTLTMRSKKVTTLQLQDRNFYQDGFLPVADFEDGIYSAADYRALFNLRDMARRRTIQDEFLCRFSAAATLSDIIQIYHLFKDEMRRFCLKLIGEGKENLPPKSLFDRLDRYLELEEAIKFIINSGGEIRIGRAYEEDGKVVKRGFVRLYRKNGA